MIGNKKAFLSALAFAMAGCVSVPAAHAADDLVLFKIHDVEPVKNDEGLVTSCSFGVTFYNRSPYTLKGVKLNLNWLDESIANTISNEKNVNKKKNNRKTSDTESKTSANVSSVVSLYNLDPQTQKTVRAKLDSDRCFLLMNDLSYDASECSITAAEGVENPYVGNEKCTSFFEFVSAENPEYYREFKAISYSEEKANEAEARGKERTEINQLYEQTLSEFNKVKAALSGIKGDVNPDDIAAASNVAIPENNSDDALKNKVNSLFPADAQPEQTQAGASANDAVKDAKNPFDGSASGNLAAETGAEKNYVDSAVNNPETPTNSSVGAGETTDSGQNTSGAVGDNAGGATGNFGGTSGENSGNNGANGGNESSNSSNSSGNLAGNSSSFDKVEFGPADTVSGIIGNGVFNDDVDISYENLGYEGKTFERPASNEKPYVTNKEKMIYNSPNAI